MSFTFFIPLPHVITVFLVLALQPFDFLHVFPSPFVYQYLAVGCPRWLSAKGFTCWGRRQGFDPRSGKIAHAVEQLRLCATAREAAAMRSLHTTPREQSRSPQLEKSPCGNEAPAQPQWSKWKNYPSHSWIIWFISASFPLRLHGSIRAAVTALLIIMISLPGTGPDLDEHPVKGPYVTAWRTVSYHLQPSADDHTQKMLWQLSKWSLDLKTLFNSFSNHLRTDLFHCECSLGAPHLHAFKDSSVATW